MFMLYDIHPYSALLSTKLIKHLSHLARNKFTLDIESESLIISDPQIHIQTLCLLSTFLSCLHAPTPTPKAQEKLDFLLANKNKITRLERALKEEGRKGVRKIVEEIVGADELEMARKISEFLLYSRNIKVESVLQMIGDKREGLLLQQYLGRFDPLMFNKNMERSIRELFTSFRLAGVESQTVERVLENFGHHYYDLHLKFTNEDGIIKFVNKKEAYEFAYLLIMLHTCHHNPNLENKTNFKWFLDSVKDLCKETYPTMKEKDLLEIFNDIGDVEFESPQNRDLLEKPFSLETLPIELYIRTKIQLEPKSELEDIEFIN